MVKHGKNTELPEKTHVFFLNIYLSIYLPIYLYLAAAHGSQVRIRAAFWWPLQFSGTEKGLFWGGATPYRPVILWKSM